MKTMLCEIVVTLQSFLKATCIRSDTYLNVSDRTHTCSYWVMMLRWIVSVHEVVSVFANTSVVVCDDVY